MPHFTTIAIVAGTVCYFIAAAGFWFEHRNAYTATCFVLYGVCNVLIMLGSKGA